MTSSRVVRGPRSRILFCICVILVVGAIVALYNQALAHLDEVRRTNDLCHQQEENLSTQLQVIFDYKQRLEKSLKTEKAEHQQTKKEFEVKLDEEHTKYEKAAAEANLKLSSLQQHYNLLKTQHGDFQEECSKTHQQQLDEVNVLQSKLKEVQGQLKQYNTEKENSFEHLKSQYMQLQVEKENLERQIRTGQNKDVEVDSNINHLTKINHELQRELDILKAKCSILPKTQELLSPSQNQIVPSVNIPNQAGATPAKQPVDDKQELVNVADLPSNVDDGHPAANEQLQAPQAENLVNNSINVLPLPNDIDNVALLNKKTSTTAKSSLAFVQPLHSPVVTVRSNINKPSKEASVQNQDQHVLPVPQIARKVPDGVVPAPNAIIESAFPNRYRNDLIENEMANEAEKLQKIQEHNKRKAMKIDTGDADNAAVEEVDPPVNNIVDPFVLDDIHGGGKGIVKQPHQEILNQHVNALKDRKGKQGHRMYDGNGIDDYDKEIQNGVRVEENGDGDDDPDYVDQKDVAVRN